MKRSEKILLAVFAVVFLVLVGGGLGGMAIRSYKEVTEESESLTQRLTQMTQTIAQGSEWQKRSAYVDEHIPKFGSHEEASSKLFETAQKEAVKAGLKVSSREMISKQVEKDGESLGYFDKASVKLTFNDAREEDLYKWMHAVYAMKSFIGITRMSLVPSGQGKSVNCEVDVTQFYREAAPQKLSKAN